MQLFSSSPMDGLGNLLWANPAEKLGSPLISGKETVEPSLESDCEVGVSQTERTSKKLARCHGFCVGSSNFDVGSHRYLSEPHQSIDALYCFGPHTGSLSPGTEGRVSGWTSCLEFGLED